VSDRDWQINRITRATVDMTREVSKGVTEIAAKTTLPDDQELQVTVTREKQFVELGRLTNKSNRIVRATVDMTREEYARK